MDSGAVLTCTLSGATEDWMLQEEEEGVEEESSQIKSL